MSKSMHVFISPIDGTELEFDRDLGYRSGIGDQFPFAFKDVPNFCGHSSAAGSDAESLDWYRRNCLDYDRYLPLTFSTFGVDETAERMKMVDAIDVSPGHRVLEIGAGTGRDSELLLERLGPQGKLFVQDISPEILEIAYDKFNDKTEIDCELNFFVSNASKLPLPDNYFDRVFHFGGLNTFAERKKAIAEMVRVVKPGGRILIGDESMPRWLRDTEFGQILMNSNPHYRFDLPLDDMPIEARNTEIRWIIGEVFYFICFDVGEGEPAADFDFTIPGVRGGTHRKRFYGNLEGVDPRRKERIFHIAKKRGCSVSELLEQLIDELERD